MNNDLKIYDFDDKFQQNISPIKSSTFNLNDDIHNIIPSNHLNNLFTSNSEYTYENNNNHYSNSISSSEFSSHRRRVIVDNVGLESSSNNNSYNMNMDEPKKKTIILN